MDEWIKILVKQTNKRRNCVYKMEFYSAVKKKDILLFSTTWMSQEDIMLSEISQTEKDKAA